MPSNANVFVERLNPKSSQFIQLYQGVDGGLAMKPLQFIAEAKILDRNLTMFRDPLKSFYHGNLSDDMYDIHSHIEWQKSNLAQKPHIDQLFCTGTSAGAYASILFGHYLEADEVHAFGAFTKIPPESLDEVKDLPEIPEEHLDLQKLLSNSNGKTQFHLYYSQGHFADYLQNDRMAGLPGVHLHPIPGNLHNVFASPEGKALLPNIFPPFTHVEA
jgi:hypothetical protein